VLLLLEYCFCYCTLIVTVLLMLRYSYCYSTLIVTVLLFLQCCYCYSTVIVTVLLLLQYCYCYSTLIVTVLLLLHYCYCYITLTVAVLLLLQTSYIRHNNRCNWRIVGVRWVKRFRNWVVEGRRGGHAIAINLFGETEIVVRFHRAHKVLNKAYCNDVRQNDMNSEVCHLRCAIWGVPSPLGV